MGGSRIQNAKEALFLFLKSLPAKCYFNVVSFGSSFSCLFEGYVILLDVEFNTSINSHENVAVQETRTM